jgi:hypothetical protein
MLGIISVVNGCEFLSKTADLGSKLTLSDRRSSSMSLNQPDKHAVNFG